MARLSRATTGPLPTTLFHLYDTHHGTRLISRVPDGPSTKASILELGIGCCVRQCSSQSLARDPDDPIVRCSGVIQRILKLGSSGFGTKPDLDHCELPLSEDLVLNVLQRHRLEWKPALSFFNWALSRQDYSPKSRVYNEMLDILGRAKEVELMRKVFDKMSQKDSIVNEETFGILTNRYACAHKVQEAVDLLYKRKEYGLEVNLAAFQMLLLCLCRHKHVKEAEALFLREQDKFPPNIKSRNIILNGWCVVGNFWEAKRFWEDILASGCKPDLFTYGTFINALAKSGELSTALDLFTDLSEKGCNPDVVICNCIIDALCYNKRIPDALRVFQEMSDHGCKPTIVTYNTLIKYVCKIGKMEKANELVDEMEKEGFRPDSKTFTSFLRVSRNAREVSKVVDRMRRSGCEIDGNTYKLVLSLYIRFNNQKGVGQVWAEMERLGLGPDQRSYTACIHWLHRKGRLDEALQYFAAMQSKGMAADTRTKLLMKEIESKRSGSAPEVTKPRCENDAGIVLAGKHGTSPIASNSI